MSTVFHRKPECEKGKRKSNTHSSHQDNILNNQQATLKTKSQTFTTETKQENNMPLHNGIILSHYNQSSPIFVSPGQGLQCIANCIMSIIYHKYKNCISWKLIDIQNIFYSGNILYNSVGKFTTILVSDLPKHIKLYNIIYNIQEVNSTIGNIFVQNNYFNSLPFASIHKIIIKYKYVILVLGCSALTIIHSGNNFYTFDPHKRNTYGLPDSRGGAAVLKFNLFEKLCLYIYKLSNHLNTTDYELTPIIVKKYNHIQHNNEQKKNSNVHEEISVKNDKNINLTNYDNNLTHFQIKNSSTTKFETIKKTINEIEPQNITTTTNKIIDNKTFIQKPSKEMKVQQEIEKNNAKKKKNVEINVNKYNQLHNNVPEKYNNDKNNTLKSNVTKHNNIDRIPKAHIDNKKPNIYKRKMTHNQNCQQPDEIIKKIKLIPEQYNNDKHNTLNSNVTKHNNNIDQIPEAHIDNKKPNIYKQKTTDNQNFQQPDKIIKKIKLMTNHQLENTFKETNKRKIDNNRNTVHPNK